MSSGNAWAVVARLRKDNERLKEELAAARHTVKELESRCERLERDNDSLREEMRDG